VISEEHGVFVSSAAVPGGIGTREAPVQTISEAIAIAAKDKKNIYVCADAVAYTEHLNLGKALDGRGIYGGFIDCNQPGSYAWRYDSSRFARIESPQTEGVNIDAVTQGIVLENLDISAKSATNPGLSSYGLFITNSQNVRLVRVKARAGAGAKGKDGVDGASGEDGALATAAKAAANASCVSPPTQQSGGAWEADSACGAGGGSRGGEGGRAFAKATYSASQDGIEGAPTTNVATPGRGIGGKGQPDAINDPKAGDNGSRGIVGENGAAAADIGSFVPAYSPASGNDGKSGFPGQGGGGGGASLGSATCVGASGGVGGMGGCGGYAGTKGQGGGASIGLLSSNSSVTLTGCEITSTNGGKGGKGGNAGGGGLGRDGGSGGNASGTILSAGRGGRGGDGGPGGSGSGGSGGPSIAIAHNGGVTWSIEDTRLIHADGGDGGDGGTVGGVPDANAAAKGQKGKAAASLQITMTAL
jgi:hypothetical protein